MGPEAFLRDSSALEQRNALRLDDAERQPASQHEGEHFLARDSENEATRQKKSIFFSFLNASLLGSDRMQSCRSMVLKAKNKATLAAPMSTNTIISPTAAISFTSYLNVLMYQSLCG